MFCARGIAVLVIDFPGHGKTDGKRGDIPSIAVAEEFISYGYRVLKSNYSGIPIGLFAHSMGGQLALRELFLNHREYAFCWLNGPLLYPAKRKHPFEIFLLRGLAKIAPQFTISTQVKRSECDVSIPKKENPLFHSQVSLRWGLALIKSSVEVEQASLSADLTIPLLVTQGERDVVNPTRYADEFFGKLSGERIEYARIPDALHEPFVGEGNGSFYRVLDEWGKKVN